MKYACNWVVIAIEVYEWILGVSVSQHRLADELHFRFEEGSADELVT